MCYPADIYCTILLFFFCLYVLLNKGLDGSHKLINRHITLVSDYTFLHHPVIKLLVLVEVGIVFGGGVLVLLVLGHQVVHVRLRLRELHLVHTLASVPDTAKTSETKGWEPLPRVGQKNIGSRQIVTKIPGN